MHIDGQKISEGEECKLRHGSRIILGSCSYVAVVMIPQEAATDTAPGYCFKHPTYEEAVNEMFIGLANVDRLEAGEGEFLMKVGMAKRDVLHANQIAFDMETRIFFSLHLVHAVDIKNGRKLASHKEILAAGSAVVARRGSATPPLLPERGGAITPPPHVAGDGANAITTGNGNGGNKDDPQSKEVKKQHAVADKLLQELFSYKNTGISIRCTAEVIDKPGTAARRKKKKDKRHKTGGNLSLTTVNEVEAQSTSVHKLFEVPFEEFNSEALFVLKDTHDRTRRLVESSTDAQQDGPHSPPRPLARRTSFGGSFGDGSDLHSPGSLRRGGSFTDRGDGGSKPSFFRSMFSRVDADGDGQITLEEFSSVMRNMGLKAESSSSLVQDTYEQYAEAADDDEREGHMEFDGFRSFMVDFMKRAFGTAIKALVENEWAFNRYLDQEKEMLEKSAHFKRSQKERELARKEADAERTMRQTLEKDFKDMEAKHRIMQEMALITSEYVQKRGRCWCCCCYRSTTSTPAAAAITGEAYEAPPAGVSSWDRRTSRCCSSPPPPN